MIIGVDAAVLSVSDERLKVGVYRYVLHALEELGKVDNVNSYRLYSFDPIDESIMKRFGSRMENRVLWPVKGWATVRLPLELSLHPVDLFLGMSQMVPQISKKSIGFIYDLGFLTRKESYAGSYEKILKHTNEIAKHSQKIITISKAVQQEIAKEYGYAKKNIAVCYPGIDDRFSKNGVSVKSPTRYFLFVGAMKSGKNIPNILKGFASFLQVSKRKFNFYVVGGNYWEDLMIDETIRTLKLQDRVKKLGYVTDDALPEYYRGATALVVPSFHEGFCMPAAEALACGCPVITSSSPVMKEVVGDAGMFVDPNKPEEIAHALSALAYNAKKRANLSLSGLVQAKQYSWSNLGRVLLHEIESVTTL